MKTIYFSSFVFYSLKQYLHSLFLQCTDTENIEYAPPFELECSENYEIEEFDENLKKENDELLAQLKILQMKFEAQKEEVCNQEIKSFQQKYESNDNRKENQEKIIYNDSKQDLKILSKPKLFKSFLKHHDEKINYFQGTIRDSLEDLERSLNHLKEDFKNVLEKQQDLLIISNNDGLNNLAIDFKQVFKPS